MAEEVNMKTLKLFCSKMCVLISILSNIYIYTSLSQDLLLRKTTHKNFHSRKYVLNHMQAFKEPKKVSISISHSDTNKNLFAVLTIGRIRKRHGKIGDSQSVILFLEKLRTVLLRLSNFSLTDRRENICFHFYFSLFNYFVVQMKDEILMFFCYMIVLVIVEN